MSKPKAAPRGRLLCWAAEGLKLLNFQPAMQRIFLQACAGVSFDRYFRPDLLENLRVLLHQQRDRVLFLNTERGIGINLYIWRRDVLPIAVQRYVKQVTRIRLGNFIICSLQRDIWRG